MVGVAVIEQARFAGEGQHRLISDGLQRRLQLWPLFTVKRLEAFFTAHHHRCRHGGQVLCDGQVGQFDRAVSGALAALQAGGQWPVGLGQIDVQFVRIAAHALRGHGDTLAGAAGKIHLHPALFAGRAVVWRGQVVHLAPVPAQGGVEHRGVVHRVIAAEQGEHRHRKQARPQIITVGAVVPDLIRGRHLGLHHFHFQAGAVPLAVAGG